MAGGIVDAELITTTVIFAGLIGAITWNLVTWYFGLPSSSSHALIGGVVGAAFAASGPDAIFGGGLLEKVIVPALVAPVVAFLTAGACILITYRMVGRLRPGSVNRGYRARPDRQRQPAVAVARHERRAEDDGHHHARAHRARRR